ncbi:hypothetical protein OEZ85_009109 [Tetradesmus obliquus]|uniref:Solute carrier family 40 protein n=1 Tax=Tetradesmus obliquus TaxID=3088 RepID=A0ABY8TL15_TETOB|nr:hypothetical protein OEZ85_009109 [Tetradesmus obliquus]
MTCTGNRHSPEWLLLVILPFSYGAATRVPFVFAGLHCRSLSLSTPAISALLGCYQLSRVAGNRTVAALQAFCKRRYQHDAAAVRTRLLQQYASNVCGTSAAFFLSGLAYSRGGLPAAADVGACFEAALLLGSAWYVASEEAAVTGAVAGAAPELAAAAFSPPQPKLTKLPSTPRIAPGDVAPGPKPFSTSTSAAAGSSFSSSDTPSWISLVVAVTFAVQALLIGSLLSAAPLLVADSMGFGAWHVGLTFAAGEALGSAALLASSTAAGQAAIRSILPMPLCLLAVLAGMSCLALLLPLVTSVSNNLALVCIALVMGLNDVGTSMSGECQGATLPERHYHSVNVMGNTLRRVGNTVTCVAAPLLYQLHPALPCVLFGGLTLLWTCALSALFAQRARECTAEDSDCIARRSAWSAANLAAAGLPAGSHLAGLEHYMQLSFVSQERRFWAEADGKTLQGPWQTLSSHALPDVSEDEASNEGDQLCEAQGKSGLVQRRGKRAGKIEAAPQ